MKKYFALLLVLLGTGCAQKITAIKDDTDNKTSSEAGYLLISFDTNTELHKIFIDGPENFMFTQQHLKSGTNYIIAELPQGKYTFENVRLSRYYYFELDDESWEFDIIPGKVNYVGNFNFEFGFFGSKILLENQSSEALRFIEKEYPKLYQSSELVYSGPGEDSFFQYAHKVAGEAKL
ncbi:hypothetical protein G3R49_16070 [Shewanella sp. WXL01]|uniref:hypothetical protein n=1 Tax=Shewanella sp. WXL01 TaxID=2709721 RepID=UPI0014385921|nr:hypothetical protein [Shewanella sp. WXL01]NKF52081.1 hypothetical protein [Shewanella sp. WXL01]